VTNVNANSSIHGTPHADHPGHHAKVEKKKTEERKIREENKFPILTAPYLRSPGQDGQEKGLPRMDTLRCTFHSCDK
jgi:hypothetical protein